MTKLFHFSTIQDFLPRFPFLRRPPALSVWTSSNIPTQIKKKGYFPFFWVLPLGPPPRSPQALPPSSSTLPGLPQPLVGLNPPPLRHCYLHRRLGRLNASPRADGTLWQHSSLRRPQREMPNPLAVLLNRVASSLQSATSPSSATPQRRASPGLLRHCRHRRGRSSPRSALGVVVFGSPYTA